jgi:uncharacterized protein YjbI with pentapeptide repeats
MRKDFKSIQIPRANLVNADLRFTNFNNANMQAVDLSHANLDNANLDEADLRNAQINTFAPLLHENFVNNVTFSSDDRFILSGSADNIIKLWDR